MSTSNEKPEPRQNQSHHVADALPSWERGLADGRLTPDQMKVLEKMVASGEADSLDAAAKRLDWQDTVLDRGDHMWGH